MNEERIIATLKLDIFIPGSEDSLTQIIGCDGSDYYIYDSKTGNKVYYINMESDEEAALRGIMTLGRAMYETFYAECIKQRLI